MGNATLGRGVVLGVTAAGLAVLTAGCGGSSPASAPAGGGTTSAGQSPPASSGTEVTADLTEFHIGLSQATFNAGTYTFVVENKGTTTHAFSVNGPGVADQHTGDLDPGKSAKLTVTLRSGGSYDIFCPVDGHRGLGMETHVSVIAGGGSPTTVSATTTTVGGGGGNGNGY